MLLTHSTTPPSAKHDCRQGVQLVCLKTISAEKYPISIQWNVSMDDTKLCLKEASMSIVPDWLNCIVVPLMLSDLLEIPSSSSSKE
jgi:hypothetical protein